MRRLLPPKGFAELAGDVLAAGADAGGLQAVSLGGKLLAGLSLADFQGENLGIDAVAQVALQRPPADLPIRILLQ
ncbi:MAG TPA: hypothetical protein VHB99_03100 [Pirellulales bacterium]|nr:hypothetical protein [Pirellulales bacterium]